MQMDSERNSRLRSALTNAGLDAVFCASPSEVLLLTGYWPIFANSIGVFTAGGDAFLFVPEDEHDLAAGTSSAQLIPYKPASLQKLTGAVQQLTEPIRQLINRLGLQHARIGLRLQLDVQPTSYAAMTQFRESLHQLLAQLAPDAALTACDTMLEQQKAIRTPRELALLKTAATVAAEAFAVAPGAIRPGLREAEVAAAIQHAFDASPAAEALDRSYGFFFCMSGPNSATAAAAYARTRQRRIQEGDLVMIHANTCADGLWTDITRTYTAGAPVPRHKEMHTAIHEARKAALDAVRPGVSARSIDAAARSVMKAHGFGAAFKHATGHGVGFAAADPDALPRIHPCSPDTLQPGMTFNVEPAAYFDGYGGMRHCDVVAVSAHGATVLTDF